MSIRSTYHHGNLRPALIAAARALLDSGGLDAVGLRETARNVGVSATATYRHFLDKESLLAAVAMQGFREFAQTLGDSMKDGAPFSAMGRAYVEFAIAHPGLFRLMFSPMMREREKFPELAAAAAAAFAGLSAGASGARPASPATSFPDAAAYSAWSMVHGLAHLYLDGAISREKMTEVVDALLPARENVAA
jgi:AcrR family transcriptional regulator